MTKRYPHLSRLIVAVGILGSAVNVVTGGVVRVMPPEIVRSAPGESGRQQHAFGVALFALNLQTLIPGAALITLVIQVDIVSNGTEGAP